MGPQDWRLLARVLRLGGRRTWGINEPGTRHLGSILEAMAGEAEAIAMEEEEVRSRDGR
jgi:hypothetical protein